MTLLQKRFTFGVLVLVSLCLILVAVLLGTTHSALVARASTTASKAKPAPGTTLLTYKGHKDSVRDALWSVDGKQIVSVDYSETLRKWDASSGKTLWSVKITNAYKIALSHDGKRIVVGTFTNDGVSEGAEIVIVDARSGKTLHTFTTPYSSIDSIAWAPNDQSIATGGNDGKLRLWNSATGVALATYPQNKGPIYAMSWSPNGRYIAVAGYTDHLVYVWDLDRDELNPFFYGRHADRVTALSWSPDGKNIASASQDKTIQIWEALSMKLILTTKSQLALSIAYSHDGKQLVAAHGDKTAQTFDTKTGRSLLVYKAHSAFVYDAQWSLDDQRIVSASADFTVKIWQAR